MLQRSYALNGHPCRSCEEWLRLNPSHHYHRHVPSASSNLPPMERQGVCLSTAASNPSPTLYPMLHQLPVSIPVGLRVLSVGSWLYMVGSAWASSTNGAWCGIQQSQRTPVPPEQATPRLCGPQGRWWQDFSSPCHYIAVILAVPLPTHPLLHLHRIQCPRALIYMVVTYSWSSTAGTHSGSACSWQWRHMLSAMGRNGLCVVDQWRRDGCKLWLTIMTSIMIAVVRFTCSILAGGVNNIFSI